MDLESATSDAPMFESGTYPATNSGVAKAVQRAETFLAVVESRRKQLDSLRAEVEHEKNSEVADNLNQCQAQLSEVEHRHADKLVSIAMVKPD